ncbi:MAG: hypothetical protein ABFD16_16850 [Thermoguttaceae bacterium]
MSILVVCPGCHKRFSVSDQFAGRTGPCPQCKTVITIPKKEEQVVIHAPEQFVSGGRSVTGKLITKPIARIDAKLRPATVAAVGGISLGILLATWVGGRMGLFADNYLLPGLGLLLVSPVIAIAGYLFLRSSDDLDTFHGKTLWMRAAICSLVYVILWGVFSYAAPKVITEEIWTWLVLAPFFLVAGSLASLASLDFDFGTGFIHYSFYILVTVVLRAAAGLGWIWQLSKG